MSDASPHIVVVVDEAEHPIFMDEVTATQVMLVQQHFAVTPAAFDVMLKAEAAARSAGMPTGTVVGPPQIAALVYLSRLQSEGKRVNADKIKDAITLGSDVEIRLERDFEPAEVAFLDPPA